MMPELVWTVQTFSVFVSLAQLASHEMNMTGSLLIYNICILLLLLDEMLQD